MRIGIITDSTASFTAEEQKQLDVKVVDLHATINDQEVYKDITPKEYYQKLVKSYGQTSAPSIGEAEEVIEKYKDEGVTNIIIVSLSKQVSATYESFRHAIQRFPELNIKLIDSDGGIVHNNAIVRNLRELFNKNVGIEEAIQKVEEIKKKVEFYFGIEGLEYLKRSGRISHAKQLIGTILKVKPIIKISNGIINQYESVRSEAKLLTRMKEIAAQKITNTTKLAYVMGVMAEDKVQELKEWILSLNPELQLIELSDVDPAMGTHTGPHSYAFGFSE